MFQQPELFQAEYDKSERNIGKQKFSPAYFLVCQCIDNRYANQYEQVGHFLDRNRIGPVPEYAKNGK